ncbi:MAG TPA: gamma carbonic anhydrase family protein [Acidimicrobiales bacterium]|nr:gamma carbonic anhydrase family protein [Acidimicrobiales bacterium]
MATYALGDLVPSIDPTAYVHPDAVVIGDVRIGPASSVWPGAVLRGDDGHIVVGARTSIQDGSILHTTVELPTTVGNDCVIGHLVHLEGCTVEDGALVGNGSIVLHAAVISSGAVVGSGAVVTGGTVVPPGALAVGIPARIREGAANAAMITGARDSYVRRAARYPQELRRID